jgi:hypothetical protein
MSNDSDKPTGKLAPSANVTQAGRTAPASADVVFLHSPTDDGKGLRVIRSRDGQIEAGEMRPLEEGKTITGDVVQLKPREGAPHLCDVTVTYSAPKPAAAADTRLGPKKPAQVASATYRDSWDRIFGAPEPRELN